MNAVQTMLVQRWTKDQVRKEREESMERNAVIFLLDREEGRDSAEGWSRW